MKTYPTLNRWLLLLAILIGAPALTQAEPAKRQISAADVGTLLPATTCLADPSWLNVNHQPPTEIGNGVPVSSETNCQFYQFSYQWFLSMMQPTSPGSDERAFEGLNLLLANQQNQCNKPKLTALQNRAALGKALFIRTSKKDDDNFIPVLPESISQAGGGEVLYDQAKNVVLYTVWYNNTECQATSTGFAPNTVEIKTSWRILSSNDPSYYTITAIVPAVSKAPIILGMVGFHLVVNTANHPEFVWATFEHKANAPDCTSPQTTPSQGWSFTSASCAACLINQTPAQCNSQCPFNTGVVSTSLTGIPNEVCRVYSDGTDPGSTTGGNNNDTNRANIDMLNAQLVGSAGMISHLHPSNPLTVLKNYFLVGGLWTNGGVSSSATDAQRGSLELSNTTMETFKQTPGENCFSCHGYTPSTPLTISHIICSLLPTSSTGSSCPASTTSSTAKAK